jgi:zinc and cadmium transporter
LNTTLAIIFLVAPILAAGLVALKISVNQNNLRLLLALSAAYLFSVSIIHLLPEAFENRQNVKLTGLFIVLGF